MSWPALPAITWPELLALYAAFKIGGLIGWLYGAKVHRLAGAARELLGSPELEDLITNLMHHWHRAKARAGEDEGPAFPDNLPHPINCGCPVHR